MSFRPLSKSIAGTAIVVSPANNPEEVHELSGNADRDTIYLELTNSHTAAVKAKIHFNGQAPQFVIPAGEVAKIGPFTIAGTASDGTVIPNKKLSVECDTDAVLFVTGSARG